MINPGDHGHLPAPLGQKHDGTLVISADTSGPCLPRRATAATSGTLGTHAPHVRLPAGDEHKTFNTSKLFAAVYPEAVDLARIIASPFWRRLAGGSPEERRRFDREVARRVPSPSREDSGTGDAIGHWALADSWRPLVQPLLTRTPAHGTGILPPLHGSRINRHEKERTVVR